MKDYKLRIISSQKTSIRLVETEKHTSLCLRLLIMNKIVETIDYSIYKIFDYIYFFSFRSQNVEVLSNEINANLYDVMENFYMFFMMLINYEILTNYYILKIQHILSFFYLFILNRFEFF